MLLDVRDAAELLRHHGGGVMVAVAAQTLDGDAGVRDRRLDQRLDLFGRHRHAGPPPSTTGRSVRAPRATPAPILCPHRAVSNPARPRCRCAPPAIPPLRRPAPAPPRPAPPARSAPGPRRT